MEIKHQSIAKHDGDYASENEDAVWVLEDKKRFFLSDGAGGTGVEAHRWSRYLLDKLPEMPIKSFDALSAWQDGIWQTYFDKIEADLKNNAPDALDKFYTEGSSATLIGVWLEGKGKGKKAHILSYGDSVVCLYREKTKEIFTNITDLSVFLESPYLLNSNDAPNEHGFYDTWSIKKGDVLLLASDTIGQFLLGSLLLLQELEKHTAFFDKIRASPQRFAAVFQELEKYYEHDAKAWQTVLSELFECLESEEKFRAYTETLRNFGILGLDDYSVIGVRF